MSCDDVGLVLGARLLLSASPLHRKMVEGFNNCFYVQRPMVSPIYPASGPAGRLVAHLHSNSRCPTSTGAVHKSVTFRSVFMLVQLNKYVVLCVVLMVLRWVIVLSVLGVVATICVDVCMVHLQSGGLYCRCFICVQFR